MRTARSISPAKIIAAISFLAAPAALAAEADMALFESVEPVIATRCVVCHGDGEQKSGLRLDRTDTRLLQGDSPVAIPGDVDTSEILARITSDDVDDRMPPEGNPPLTPGQIEAVRAWIAGGAPWPEGHTIRMRSDHWAFQKPVRPDVPEVKNSEWVRNPIDAFILAKLEKEGVEPSPEADRHTLVRRLYLDLIGIPPTPDEVDAFVKDTSPYAYEALVNRLLASPHFGERWGRHWLDLARYADSDGYEKDGVRPYAYRYRDYVIDALNRDVPYDQFVVEQLAGDLLPNPTQAQLIATGFHRNTLTNTEGGIDPEEDRVKQAKDRTSTTATVFLGLTMACAECHSHKYDPITQREYYGMYSFFNRASEKNIPAPAHGEVTAYEEALARYNGEYARLKQEVDKERPRVADRLPAWEAKLDLPEKGWLPIDPLSYSSSGGSEFKELDDQSLLLTGEAPHFDDYTVIARTRETNIRAIRLEALTDDSLTKNGPGRAHNGNFVLGEFTVYAAPISDPTKREQVKIKNVTADFEEKGNEAARAIDGDPETGWAIYRESDMNVPRTATFTLETPLPNEEGVILTFEMAHRYGRAHAIGRFRISITPENPIELAKYPDDVLAALRIPAEERTEAQQNRVIDYYAEYDPELQKRLAALRGLQKAKPTPPATQAQTIAANPEPPKTFIHVRGDFLTKGAEVQTQLPAVLPALQKHDATPTRLDLAEWIISPDNPLTARVQANRVWTYLFGEGIVRTPGDFGTRGELPTHPQLLDWLATEYMARGWSTKDMIRLIAGSSAYRQASHVRPDLYAHDSQNRLIARQNRFRVTAEVTRDSYLAASGLLDRTIGGPSIRPPLPDGITNLGYANSIRWNESRGTDKYRRGIYIFFQRTVPYPMLMTFDCPDSNVTNTDRTRSNTPLQALTLLNDQVFFEAAQALGGRLMSESFEDDRTLVTRAFRLCLGREPSNAESDRLTSFVQEQRERFASEKEAAVRFSSNHQPKDADPIEAAAATALARVIMNLDEFVTRE